MSKLYNVISFCDAAFLSSEFSLFKSLMSFLSFADVILLDTSFEGLISEPNKHSNGVMKLYF